MSIENTFKYLCQVVTQLTQGNSINPEDLLVGKKYKNRKFPEQTFVYMGKASTFSEDYDFDCVDRGSDDGIICTPYQVIRDITAMDEK
jgi:hypothetical protein